MKARPRSPARHSSFGATPPTIANTHTTTTTSDAAVNPFAGVTITDLNAGATDTLTITLSNGGEWRAARERV